MFDLKLYCIRYLSYTKHSTKCFTGKILFNKSFCNLLIENFKMERFDHKNKNSYSFNTIILKSPRVKIYKIQFEDFIESTFEL